MRTVKVGEYTIYEDGKILGIYGKKLKTKKQIKINGGDNKKSRYVSYARFVYYAFHQDTFDFDNKSITIRQINKCEDDYNINNLVAIERKSYNQGENNVSSKLTNKQVEEIKDIYFRAKDENLKTNNPFVKVSYRTLAEQYGVSHTMIAGIIKGTLRNKENYKL